MLTSCISSATISWHHGLNSDDLSTTVLPQISGTAMARMLRVTGAFHGAMASLTPHQVNKDE